MSTPTQQRPPSPPHGDVLGGGEGGGAEPPPPPSSSSLPPLSFDFRDALGNDKAKFSTSSAECTSLKITPSGRFVVAGFTDGTLRLFPTTNHTVPPSNNNNNKPPSKMLQEPQRKDVEAAAAALASMSTLQMTSGGEAPAVPSGGGSKNGSTTNNNKTASAAVVVTHTTSGKRRVQASSNVAAQIVSKGVHTSLLMDVDVTPDGLWAFAGVLRGSMELVALHLGHLEAAVDDYEAKNLSGAANSTTSASSVKAPCWSDWMDTLTVYKQVDAKLRGFGACTCLDADRYLLLTGKAIKNIHIWSFTPPRSDADHPVWTQLYDTQTNGNTIKWLSFHVNPSTGRLSALSKSDGQKLRVWDLTYEQTVVASTGQPPQQEQQVDRPTRPPFVDVANTEGMLGVAGGYAICGGASESMYHQVGLVNLNSVGDLQSPYNHTELALPSSPDAGSNGIGDSGSMQPRRRQQRGDLKSVERVAGIEGQAILELSDGNLVQFQATHGQGQPALTWLGKALPTGYSRQICVARVASCGLAVAATAVYNPAKGKGWIRLWPMECVQERLSDPYLGFWGFQGVPRVPKPVRGKSNRSVAARKSPVEAPKAKAVEPPASVVKASAPPTAVSSIQKENRAQPLSDASIVTPRFSEAIPPSAGSLNATSRSVSAGRPYRVSMEPVQLDRTIDVTPGVRERGIDAKRRQSNESMQKAGGTGSTAPEDSTRKKKRKSVDGRALTPAVASGSFKSPPHEPRSSLDAVVLDDAREKSAREPTSTAPKRPIGEDQRVSNAGIRASVTRPVANGTLSCVKFKSPMRRDKKRSNKAENATQSRIASECKKRMGVLEQLLKNYPEHCSPLLQEIDSLSTSNLVERHVGQQRNLLLSQGASYDRLIKSVFNRAVQTLDSIVQAPTVATLNEAREAWAQEIQWFEQMEEETTQQHALEMNAMLARQSWECQQVSHIVSTPSAAGGVVSPSRNDVQSILLQLRDSIPQFCD